MLGLFSLHFHLLHNPGASGNFPMDWLVDIRVRWPYRRAWATAPHYSPSHCHVNSYCLTRLREAMAVVGRHRPFFDATPPDSITTQALHANAAGANPAMTSFSPVCTLADLTR